MRFARGHLAWTTCQRSGQRLLYRDAVMDGYLKNLVVAPEWFEPFPIQQTLPRVEDPIALYRPTPDDPPSGEGTPAPPITSLPYD